MPEGRQLAGGAAAGPVLVLDEPLSMWGGLDPATGAIVDRRHPQLGATVAGRVLVMPHGRGSSSAASVLAEALRAGAGPAAIVLREADEILAVGALVAAELYGVECPVVVLDAAGYAAAAAEDELEVDGGRVVPPGG